MCDCVIRSADLVFRNVYFLEPDIKVEAYNEYISIAKKGQKMNKKMGLAVLCIHNVMRRREYYSCIARIAKMMNVDESDIRWAKKYFRKNNILLEKEDIGDVLKFLLEKMNVKDLDIQKVTQSLLDIKSKSDCIDRFMYKSLAAGVIYLLVKEKIDINIVCAEIGISKNTLNDVIKELKGIKFISC